MAKPGKPMPRPDTKAIALSYEAHGVKAPEVVAKGSGWIAEKILQLAFEHNVKVREDADLVELLSALEIGEEIPVEAFAAVAEILAYVYRATGETPPEILAAVNETLEKEQNESETEGQENVP